MHAVASQGHQPEPTNLQLLVDSVPALIHTALPDGCLDFFNQTWLKYVGLSLGDLQGWKWTAAIHPEDVEGILSKWRTSLASGEPFLHGARVRRAGFFEERLGHRIRRTSLEKILSELKAIPRAFGNCTRPDFKYSLNERSTAWVT